MSLEDDFDVSFAAALALREKQIQQSYRPIIGVHKWFARRPGTVFRNLLLAEFNGEESIATGYWRAHEFSGVIADPFMGGGTPIYEANRLGFSVVGTDVNPMAYWIVRQAIASLSLTTFASEAATVIADVEKKVGSFYRTECLDCGSEADIKYFLWVKKQVCPSCGTENDLFPGYLLAEATRHPRHVLSCGNCGALNEYEKQPSQAAPAPCSECAHPVHIEGPARRNRITCRHCDTVFAYPPKPPIGPPQHRMWAIEYHCAHCKPGTIGRFFKRPSGADLARYDAAQDRFVKIRQDLPIPGDAIPAGDETDRLHRWGYQYYHEMFNRRQLLGLGLLLQRIQSVKDAPCRQALLTVFSDFLRYQNMLCRYDTYALKCQDIFSVHGFPVGLVQCENNLLGIRNVGSGSFRHFIEKYLKAKRYAEAPFETRFTGRKKEVVHVKGERIAATLTEHFPRASAREAQLLAAPATEAVLPAVSLDGVFTDPPYFDNVQYAELMDFCFAWLRLGLKGEIPSFARATTRTAAELTGNDTMGRGIEHFTDGLSAVFRHYAAALKPNAPFVFTYHHNAPTAYVPLVVAILDAGLDCTACLPAPAEMGASLHIARTGSSVVDSVFVCRSRAWEKGRRQTLVAGALTEQLRSDARALAAGGVQVTEGDVRCLLAGHVARLAVNQLRPTWDSSSPLGERMQCAREMLAAISLGLDASTVLSTIQTTTPRNVRTSPQYEAAL